MNFRFKILPSSFHPSFQWMRRIDSWIGIPLTWILGRWTRRVKSLWGDFQFQHPPERVICAKFIGLGSIVLSLPLLKALKDAGIQVGFWSFPGQADLVELSGYADQVWKIRPSLKYFLFDVWKTFWAVRRFRAQAFLDLEPTANFSALLARFSGADVRVGFMSAKPTRESLFTHLVALTPERHMVENHLNMGYLLGLRPASGKVDLPELPASILTPQEQDPNLKKILMNINASDLSWHRLWPEEHWIQLSGKLLQDPRVILYFSGSPSETKRVKQLLTKLLHTYPWAATRCVDLAGKTSLTQLLQFLHHVNLVVSVDSGIMHLAAWANAPLVALFGPETPSLYAPRSSQARVLWAALPCSPCLTAAADKRTRCLDAQCMKQIDPRQVYRACDTFIEGFEKKVA